MSAGSQSARVESYEDGVLIVSNGKGIKGITPTSKYETVYIEINAPSTNYELGSFVRIQKAEDGWRLYEPSDYDLNVASYVVTIMVVVGIIFTLVMRKAGKRNES